MTFIRPAVKRRLRDIAQHALPDVRCTYTWDGRPVADSTLWLGPVEGSVDPESIGRQPLDVDLFSIPVRVELLGHATPEDAEDAAMDAVNALDAALWESQRLTGVTGLPDGDTASYRGVVTVRIARMDGPGHSLPNRGAYFGWCELELLCTANVDRLES